MPSIEKLIKYFFVFLGTILILVLLIGSIVIYRFKQSKLYNVAVEYAKSNNQIQIKTGGVVETGYMVAFIQKDSTAYVSFSLKGKEENVSVYCDLTLIGDKWIVSKLEYH